MIILIVDDNKGMRECLKRELQDGCGQHCIVLAENGGEAWTFVQRSPPDLVIADINMPVMDGIETLRRIRKMKPDIPVVMVTAYEDEEKFSAARKLKISGFFSKKGSLEELQTLIETILRTHKKLKPSK